MLTIISYKMNNQTKQIIENILITSLEGGSNYWYMFKEFEMVQDNKLSYVENIIYNIINTPGFEIIVIDCETEEYLGILSKEFILKGLNLAREQYKEEYDMIISEDYDASIADVLFQLIIMGEIVYG